MASADVPGQYVVFPSDLRQWGCVVQQLTELRDTLLAEPSPGTLVTRLNDICSLVHTDPEHDPSAREGSHSASDNQKGFRPRSVFKGLGLFLAKEASKDEAKQFFQIVFPCIVRHACAIGDRKPHEGLQLLLTQEAKTLQLPRSLVASVVACGFLCLFPGRKADRTSAFSPINFDGFFCHLSQSPQCAKLRCVLNYFCRIASCDDGPKGHLSFTRKVLTEDFSLDHIRASDLQLCPICVSDTGLIEDSGHNFLHVDFANKKIGGGVLGTGRVQEEIRFCMSPELLCSMLLFEAMDDNEAILIEGFETYSAHKGYARTFQFEGNLQDTALRDTRDNLDTSLCCIDALPRASRRQYDSSLVLREVNKAVIGFLPVHTKHSAMRDRRKGRPEPTREVERFSDTLSSSILAKAVEEAAASLNSRRHRRGRRGSVQAAGGRHSGSGVAPAAAGRPSRRGSCQVAPGGLLSSDRLSVGAHSSEGESGHSDTSDMDESLTPEPDLFPTPVGSTSGDPSGAVGGDPLLHGYPDRAWFPAQAQRRRSSNLSDLSRRSSDAVSRRSSRSSSTRWSSDFSSDFEEFYESLQRTRHDAIEEEIGSASLQNLMGDAVTDRSSLQHFEDAVAPHFPPGVARPRPQRPLPGRSPSVSPIHPDLAAMNPDHSPRQQELALTSGYFYPPDAGTSHLELSPMHPSLLPTHHDPDSSNQTDDEKIQDNIVTFAGNLVGEMLQGSTPPRNFSSSSSSGESVLNALGISAEDLISVSSRRARSRESVQFASRRSSGSSSSRTGGHVDPPEPPAVSNVVNRLVGGALTEALSLRGPRPIPGSPGESGLSMSPVSLRHQGPSLTDDIKEALASSGFRSYSAGSSPRTGARASVPNTQFLHPRYSLTSASVHHLPTATGGGGSPQHSFLQHSPPIRAEADIFPDVEDFAQSLSRTILADAKLSATSHSQHGGGGARPKVYGSHLSKSHSRQKVRADNAISQRKPEMQAVAEQLVMSTVQGAVEEVYGYRHVRVPFSDRPIPQRQRSASATVIIRRKGSTEEDLTDFVEDLDQRCSFGALRQSRRHTTTGFRDQTLADFANELMASNPSSPSFRMFEEEVNRTNMEIPKLYLGESAFGRRGSNSSRASSSDRSPRTQKRRSSFELLLESFTKFSASIEKYIKFDIEDTKSTHSSILLSDPRTSREALFEFLARCRSREGRRKNRTSSLSHLEWYVEDLVIDSFHDGFVEVFGDNYSELIQSTLPEKRAASHKGEQTLHVPNLKPVGAVRSYVSSVVDEAFTEAFQCLLHHRRDELLEARKRDSTTSSCYEDAFDVPYSNIEDFSQSLAEQIMRQVINEVTRAVAKEQQEPPCRPIATGNWGCGAFGGDPQLKSAVQWAAASLVGAPKLNYYTFRDERMAQFEEVSRVLSQKRWTVGRLMTRVVEYCERRVAAKHPDNFQPLFDFLLKH